MSHESHGPKGVDHGTFDHRPGVVGQKDAGWRILRAVLDEVPELVAIVDEHGRLLRVNRAWRLIAGDETACEGQSLFALGPGLSLHETFLADCSRVLRGEVPSAWHEVPTGTGGAEGRHAWQVLRLDAGLEPARAVVIGHEANRAGHILNALLDPVIAIDASGTIRTANGSVERMFGYRPEELVGRNIKVLMPEPYRSEHDAHLQRFRKTGRTWIMNTTRQFPVRRNDGSQIVCELSVSRVEAPSQPDPTFIGSFRDATDRVRAERALVEARRRLAAVFDQAFHFLGLLTPDGTVLEMNRAALEFAGVARDAVIGRPFWETLWWPWSTRAQERLRQSIRSAGAGQLVRYEFEVPTRGQQRTVVDFSLKPVVDRRGQIEFLIPEGRDVTELRRSQQEEWSMLRTLASIGESAAMLVHELKSPITGINMALQALAERLGEEHEVLLRDLERRLSRLERMVRHTLAYARPPVVEPIRADVRRILAGAVAQLRAVVDRDGAEVTTEVEAGAEECRADPARMEDLLTGLVVNAIEAKGCGAKVVLSARAAGPASIELRVEDNGPGIAPQLRERLFQPFVSTKRSGTGLGLVICKRIVEQHGGSISVADSRFGGAGFSILLPKWERASV